jgi:molecular chaperone GrpE (heat shock protein)
MTRDPFAEQSARLLAALDFGEETAARERQHRQAMAAILGALLEVMDGFDRLLAGAGDGAAGDGRQAEEVVPLRTVRLLARQLSRCLQGAGVVACACLGEAVDPESHEVAEVRETGAAAPDTIVEIVTQGYRWNGELLRRPRVIVAAASEEKQS